MASPYRSAPDSDDATSPAPSVFPAGAAVLALVPGFFAIRVFSGLAELRARVALTGTFAIVLGVLLALAASARITWDASAPRGRWLALGLRAFGLAPVVGLGLAAMFSTEVSFALQASALAGLALTVLFSGGRSLAITVGRRDWLPAATVALLVAGELIELFGPMALYASQPGTRLPRVVDALGHVSEGCAFAGVALAVAWAVRNAVRRVGLARTMAYVAMPAAFSGLLLTLPRKLPRTTETVARAAFGARFDLLGVGGAGHPSRAVLAVYTLLFAGLVAAATVSLATQSTDRGGGVRRALAWTCLLLAGFGAATVAGPLDPLRAVSLALGMLLLEQAVDRE